MLLSVIVHASLIIFSSFWMTGITQQIKSNDNVILNFILSEIRLYVIIYSEIFWRKKYMLLCKLMSFIVVFGPFYFRCMVQNQFLSWPWSNLYHFQAVSETAIDIGLYPKAATGFNPYGHFVTFMIRLVRLLFPPKSDLSERREKNKIPRWFLPADWIKAAFLHDEWPLKWNILISNGHK